MFPRWSQSKCINAFALAVIAMQGCASGPLPKARTEDASPRVSESVITPPLDRSATKTNIPGAARPSVPGTVKTSPKPTPVKVAPPVEESSREKVIIKNPGVKQDSKPTRPQAMAPSPQGGAPLPKLLQEVEAKYASSGALKATFNQVQYSAVTQKSRPSSGLLLAKRGGKMRWETKQPDAHLLVSDGTTLWYYTPPMDEEDRGQYTARPARQVRSELAHALLNGEFSGLKMKIEEKGATKFLIVPKRGTSGTVERAEIQVNPASKLIEYVKLFHSGGNTAEIKLSAIELGAKLKDSDFKFVPPANTDRMEE